MFGYCFRPLLITALLAAPVVVLAAEKISLQALFGNKAMLLVDGKRHLLAPGQSSPEGVKLIVADTIEETATIEVDGKEEVLQLGMVAASAIKSSSEEKLTVWANSNGHFLTKGYINDVQVHFLVDTGATDIALNSNQAKKIGLDYKIIGQRGLASTAGGMVYTYRLKLSKVQIGKITLHNVDAAVIEGNYPTQTLLGMSFLSRLNLKQEGNQLHLLLKR